MAKNDEFDALGESFRLVGTIQSVLPGMHATISAASRGVDEMGRGLAAHEKRIGKQVRRLNRDLDEMLDIMDDKPTGILKFFHKVLGLFTKKKVKTDEEKIREILEEHGLA
ncbi:MAG: hypothetical protein IJY90_00580 [Clostridia bacterium]|nr:hypothetical protein [Clostridia bacterium]